MAVRTVTTHAVVEESDGGFPCLWLGIIRVECNHAALGHVGGLTLSAAQSAGDETTGSLLC